METKEKVFPMIRELRQRYGLPQREMAKFLGCTVSAYCQYEKGKRTPSVHTIIQLADFYAVSTDEILGHKIKKGRKRLLPSAAINQN